MNKFLASVVALGLVAAVGCGRKTPVAQKAVPVKKQAKAFVYNVEAPIAAQIHEDISAEGVVKHTLKLAKGDKPEIGQSVKEEDVFFSSEIAIDPSKDSNVEIKNGEKIVGNLVIKPLKDGYSKAVLKSNAHYSLHNYDNDAAQPVVKAEEAPVAEAPKAEPTDAPAAEPSKEEAPPAAEPTKEEVKNEAPAAEPTKEEAPAAEPSKEAAPEVTPSLSIYQALKNTNVFYNN